MIFPCSNSRLNLDHLEGACEERRFEQGVEGRRKSVDWKSCQCWVKLPGLS